MMVVSTLYIYIYVKDVYSLYYFNVLSNLTQPSNAIYILDTKGNHLTLLVETNFLIEQSFGNGGAFLPSSAKGDTLDIFKVTIWSGYTNGNQEKDPRLNNNNKLQPHFVSLQKNMTISPKHVPCCGILNLHCSIICIHFFFM